jgi:hypothetical protein
MVEHATSSSSSQSKRPRREVLGSNVFNNETFSTILQHLVSQQSTQQQAIKRVPSITVVEGEYKITNTADATAIAQRFIGALKEY